MDEPATIGQATAPEPTRNLRFYLANTKWLLQRRVERFVLRLRGVRLHPTAEIQNVCFHGPAVVEANTRLLGNPRLEVGRHCYIGPHIHCQGDIVLGDRVWVGPRVTMWGRDHGILPGIPICKQPHRSEPIRVERDVEIGPGAILLRGISVGAGASLGANSVCTRDIPAGAVVSGCPARPHLDTNGDTAGE
jgi:acetyltransferase-like isoleucine patch superfamily enzyme